MQYFTFKGILSPGAYVILLIPEWSATGSVLPTLLFSPLSSLLVCTKKPSLLA